MPEGGSSSVHCASKNSEMEEYSGYLFLLIEVLGFGTSSWLPEESVASLSWSRGEFDAVAMELSLRASLEMVF